MKIVLLALAFLSAGLTTFAQKDDDEERDHSFKRENIFIGGGLGLGLGNGGFSAGLNPEIGYSIAQWLDAGISTNFNYFSFNAESNGGWGQKSFNYGAGMFVRLYPIRGFFIQALPEYNIITTTLTNAFSGYQEKIKQQAPSFLLGVGYSSREIGASSFYTVIMFDTGNNPESPYIGQLGSKNPILRTGFNFYLRPKKK